MEGDSVMTEVRGNWWVVFSGRASGSVVGGTEKEAREFAAPLGTVTAVHGLPYPRSPVLNPAPGQCPAFCIGRSECLDKTACPQSYACSE